MSDLSARAMLARLPIRMADGGEVSDAYRGAAARGDEGIQEYYAWLRDTAQKYLADTDAPTGADAYNIMVESGISTTDLINAGVGQKVLDKIFTVTSSPDIQTLIQPSEAESAYLRNPVLAAEAARISAEGQNGVEVLKQQAKDYVARIAEDGITPQERAEMQQIATERGYTLQDFLATGIDPSILFNVQQPAPVIPTPTLPLTPPEPTIPSSQTVYEPSTTQYTPTTVYDPAAFAQQQGGADIYQKGAPALDEAFRESAPRTAVGGFGYDYTPAAKLLSATGSGWSWTPPSVTSRPRSLLGASDLYYGPSQSQLFAQNRQAQGPQFQKALAPAQAASSGSGSGSPAPVYIDQETGMYKVTPVDLRVQPFKDGGPVSKLDRMLAEESVKKSVRPAQDALASYADGGIAWSRLGPSEDQGPRTESHTMLQNILGGAKEIPTTVYNYGRDIAASESPLREFGSDVASLGRGMYEGAKEDPLGFALDMTPVVGEVRSALDAEKYSQLANEAEAAGDHELARILRQVVTMSAAGTVPLAGAGARGAKRAAKAAADQALEKAGKGAAKQMLEELTPTTEAIAPPRVADDVPPVDGEAMRIGVVDQNAKGHALPPELLVEGTGQKAETPVVQSFTPKNKDAVIANIDATIARHPDALTSEQSWKATEAEAFGGDYLPAPPSQAVKYNNDPSLLAAKLDRLTPELKATVDEGFGYVNQIKNIYNSQVATPEMTGRLFMWGILSRGAGPVQQEAAFIDLLDRAQPFIAKSARGEFTESDLPAWQKMVKESLPEGSPARQVTMNANAAGKLLYALSQTAEGTNAPALTLLHKSLADPKVTGREFRRQFFRLTNNPGIDNKVVSFIGLVGGKDDMLVMDRIQSRHLWDDGRYEGKNIYDGINKGGLSKILVGPRGLMLTEMLENGMGDTVSQAYRMIGRPQDGSIGRMHWETWLIEGNQGVSHSTLQAVRSGTAIGAGVTEGKPGTFSSGMTYRQAIEGPIVEYPLSDGSIVRMTPERQKEFEAFVKSPANDIIPQGFKVTESVSGPWYTRPEVDRRKLDEAARQFENANPDGSLRSGDVRYIQGRGALSQRRNDFLTAFRRDAINVAKSTRGVSGGADGRNLGRESGPYTRETLSTDGGDGLLTFSPDQNTLTQYQSASLSLPVIRQVDSATNAAAYNADMTRAMASNPMGAQVEIKSPEELANARLFRTESGSGFAIKPDGDIVAVFASSNEPIRGSYGMLQAAVQAGGKKLDAFNTYLPKIYESVGFKPVARLPWNDEFAPPNWDKNTFREYNNGEPDIVFFVHDPEYFGGAKNVPYAKDYDDAVRIQTDELNRLSPEAKGIGSLDAVLDMSQEARMAGAGKEAVDTYYHGGKLSGAIKENEGLFDGIFLSPSKAAATSHGESLYSFDIPPEKIARSGDFIGYSDFPWEQQKAAILRTNSSIDPDSPDFDLWYKAVAEDRADELDSESLARIFGREEVGENQWEAQRQRGRLAKELGYDAVNMSDEHGTSVLLVRDRPYTPANKAKGGEELNLVKSITEEQREAWRNANKGDFRQTQTPELAEAARDLDAGKISIEDYAQKVKELRPIELITEVPEISSFEEIAYALDKNKVEKGLIGLNKEIPDGTLVGSRLDIPAYNNYDTWVVSVHEGTGVSGKSMGYGKVAVLDDVKFNSNPDAALGVATGKKDKAPFARMNGKWRNMDVEEARGLAEKYLNDPEWTQIGMNPYRHSFFYDKNTGMPVNTAEQVIQIGPLVLAKKVTTRPLKSQEHMLKGSTAENPKYFKRGGNVERQTHDNRKYI